MKRSRIRPSQTHLRRSRMRRAVYRKRDTVRGLRDELDTLTSLIVRKRDGACVICGTTRDLTASHFYRRQYMAIRFDLRNVAAMCVTCNFRHSEDATAYTQWFLDLYSDETMRELYRLRTEGRCPSFAELKEMVNAYRETLRMMR